MQARRARAAGAGYVPALLFPDAEVASGGSHDMFSSDFTQLRYIPLLHPLSTTGAPEKSSCILFYGVWSVQSPFLESAACGSPIILYSHENTPTSHASP